MGMTTFEKQILTALKIETGNRKLKERDMLEWRTSPIKAQEGERVVHLKSLGVYVALPDPGAA